MYWPTNNIKMKNNQFEKVNIKNRRSYYLNDIIKFEDFDSDEIRISKTNQEYLDLRRFLIGTRPLRFRFYKIDGFIRVYDGGGYLVLFGPEKYDADDNRIRYLIGLKGGIK